MYYPSVVAQPRQRRAVGDMGERLVLLLVIRFGIEGVNPVSNKSSKLGLIIHVLGTIN